MRLVRFLDSMYAERGERLRSKAALVLAHLATDNEANAQAIVRHGGFAIASPMNENAPSYLQKGPSAAVLRKCLELEFTQGKGPVSS